MAHTKGISKVLPSFVQGLWGVPSAIVEVAIDAERGILYARHQNSLLEARPPLSN